MTVVARKRINRVVTFFLENGDERPERRGDSRITPVQCDIQNSIKEHIKSLRVSQSHYNRKKSEKQYLPSYLSIAELWRVWTCSKCLEYEKKIAAGAGEEIACEYKLHKLRAQRFYQEL